MNDAVIRAKSTISSTRRLRREENAAQHHRPAGRRLAGLVDVGEEAGELDEERERHEHADERHPAVVEAAVGKARRSEPGGDRREQHDGSLLGDAAAHEPVGGVVAAALADGPPLDEADGGDERRVEDRHREHEQRQDQRRDRRLRDLPARQQAERGEREPDHLASRVAHEDGGRLARPEVERQEAGDREREGERDDEQQVVGVDRHGVDGEEGGGDHGERPREPVHVVEQVERVRHADEPERADRRRENAVRDDLDP